MLPAPHEWPDEEIRAYLAVLAKMHMVPCLVGIVDPSDVVQETLLKAYRQRSEYRGVTSSEETAWLRRILVNTMIDTLRKHRNEAARRIGTRDCAQRIDASSHRLEEMLAAEESSPSEVCQRHEQLLALATALLRLPSDQRQAVELRHLQELPIAEISRLMGRSSMAVGGLIYRGLKGLRESLGKDPF